MIESSTYFLLSLLFLYFPSLSLSILSLSHVIVGDIVDTAARRSRCHHCSDVALKQQTPLKQILPLWNIAVQRHSDFVTAQSFSYSLCLIYFDLVFFFHYMMDWSRLPSSDSFAFCWLLEWCTGGGFNVLVFLVAWL